MDRVRSYVRQFNVFLHFSSTINLQIRVKTCTSKVSYLATVTHLRNWEVMGYVVPVIWKRDRSDITLNLFLVYTLSKYLLSRFICTFSHNEKEILIV